MLWNTNSCVSFLLKRTEHLMRLGRYNLKKAVKPFSPFKLDRSELSSFGIQEQKDKFNFLRGGDLEKVPQTWTQTLESFVDSDEAPILFEST